MANRQPRVVQPDPQALPPFPYPNPPHLQQAPDYLCRSRYVVETDRKGRTRPRIVLSKERAYHGWAKNNGLDKLAKKKKKNGAGGVPVYVKWMNEPAEQKLKFRLVSGLHTRLEGVGLKSWATGLGLNNHDLVDIWVYIRPNDDKVFVVAPFQNPAGNPAAA